MSSQSKHAQDEEVVVVDAHFPSTGYEPKGYPEEPFREQAARFTEVNRLTQRIQLLEAQNEILQKEVRYLQELCLMD